MAATGPSDPMFTTERMSAIFSPESRVRRLLEFEAALARAEARAGIIPERAAEAIGNKCDVGLYDVPALEREAAVAGTLALPLVRRLTEHVQEDARGFVHWGTTSQDALDTGMVLQVREGLDVLVDDLLAVGSSCASLAERHAATPMAGRTLLQHAVPITFGLKAAHWLSLTTSQVHRLVEARGEALAVQLGGAAGTLAALGGRGIHVAELLAGELDLAPPDLPWHTDRDRVALLAGALGTVAGAMGKIATDVVLLAQTEVGEVSEGAAPGKGRSSAMPQKRNAVDATFALSAARLAIGVVPVLLWSMVQEHERAVGGWQAEWAAVPELFRHTAGAVGRVRTVVENLEVDPQRMRANLEASGGQVMAEALAMALATHVGRHEAHDIVAGATRRAAEGGVDLRTAAGDDERVRALVGLADLDRILDPATYLGDAEAFVGRAIERFREVAARARQSR
jgi:3-carboxy-cis,cis-muconate cycloisomerase